jgi:predicted nucleotidyltransferase
MDRQQIINAIRRHRDALAELGVAHLSLFGSVARGAAKPSSDVDVIVDSPDGSAFGLLRLARISRELETLLDRKIDLLSQRGLNNAPKLQQRIAADVVNVF